MDVVCKHCGGKRITKQGIARTQFQEMEDDMKWKAIILIIVLASVGALALKPSLKLTPSDIPVSSAEMTYTFSFIAANTGKEEAKNVQFSWVPFSSMPSHGSGFVSDVSYSPNGFDIPGESSVTVNGIMYMTGDWPSEPYGTQSKFRILSSIDGTSVPASAVVTATSHWNAPNPSLAIEKHTNGKDADSAPGPNIPAGNSVLWEYIVTNDGNVTLTDIVVSDNVLGTIGIISSLVPGQSMTLQANGAAVVGQYVNEGIASANFGGAPIVANDFSHYFGQVPPNPALHIEKSTNGQDADIGPGPTIPVGQPVTWTYTVTNIGNVPLFNIEIEDSEEGPINVIASLDPGAASQPFTHYGIAVAGQYENEGMATSEYGGVPVVAYDLSHYFGLEFVPSWIEGKSARVSEFALHPSMPNPFNSVTTISYDLPKTTDVVIKIYSMLGNEVRTLVESSVKAGQHLVVWDATDNSDNKVSSGIYFIIIQAGEFSDTQKITLLK
jgi:hypothetical protein